MTDDSLHNHPNDEIPPELRCDLIQVAFGLQWEQEPIPQASHARLQQLQEMLAERIAHLLDESLDSLMAALYRLDVSETKVREAFSLQSRSAIAKELARIVIERQLLRIRTRRERSASNEASTPPPREL